MRTHPLNRTAPVYALALLTALIAGAGCRSNKPPVAHQSGPLPLNTFRRDWQTTLQTKTDPVKQLFVRNDQLFVYTKSGKAAALKRDTGLLQFFYPVVEGGFELHPPVVLKKHVVYPTATALQVYEPEGRFIKTIRFDFAVRTDAAGAGTAVYFGADHKGGVGRFEKVDVTDAYVPVRWELMAKSGGFAAGPTVIEDAVYAGGLDGNVYAVAGVDRNPIWSMPGNIFSTGGPIRASIGYDANTLYVASTDSVLYVLNRNNGVRRWQYFAGVPLLQTPSVTADRVYLFVDHKGLVVLSKAEGKYNREPLWIGSDVTQFLAQDDRYAYVVTKDKTIQARDKTTGDVKFQTKRKDFTVFATNQNDATIYASTADGRITAVKAVLTPGVIGELVFDTQGEWSTEPLASR